MATSLEPLSKFCTVTSPAILLDTAVRISSIGGLPANFTVMSVPPLKSIPYKGPPFRARLTKPATVSTSDAMMNGHFLPRKSKFVFLNNSIAQPLQGHTSAYEIRHQLRESCSPTHTGLSPPAF